MQVQLYKVGRRILLAKLADSIPSLKWGRTHESDAFSEYLENQVESEQKNIRKAGFYIGEPSYLGASPYGIVEGSGGLKIIEIKFPYSVRDLSIKEDDGILHLS